MARCQGQDCSISASAACIVIGHAPRSACCVTLGFHRREARQGYKTVVRSDFVPLLEPSVFFAFSNVSIMPAAVTPPLTEGPPSPLAAALPPGTLEAAHLETASKILEIIARYRIRRRDVAAKSQYGTLGFLAQVYTMVVAGAPIDMCLPAFPFKSPNSRSKVLGRLPDKAEEFALANLNGLCAAIGDVYPAGAKLMIISDGLVYNGELPCTSISPC